MPGVVQDQWAQWVLSRRIGGDAEFEKRALDELRKVRDIVLRNASVAERDVVLDVGCGDGLIAFGALERVGERGKVIFSDISMDLLNHDQVLAREIGVLQRCAFVHAPANDLAVLSDGAVDVVTTRSVLIYVAAKLRAFQEFHRVLKP